MTYVKPDRCAEPDCKFRAVAAGGVCERHGGQRRTRAVGTTAPMDHMPLCGATTRTGGQCRQPRMRGTSRCKLHGGKAPQVQQKAREVVAQSVVAREMRYYGEPRGISAIDALVQELHRTQGHVDYLGQQVAARPQDTALLAVYAAERDHLSKLADAMVRNKLDQRQAVLSERTLDRLETALNGIVRDLGHDPSDSYVRGIIARRMREVAAGETTQNDPDVIDAEIVYDEPRPVAVAF
ncbi:HGGxSTG domain-containing protein [Blastococcus sp. SYSU DS0552]